MADDVATTEDTVSITIDGQPVTAPAGQLLIAAAEAAGVYIPRFCYHPRMRPVGMCRMCLVDVKGPRGYALQPACFIPVAEGQEVVTDSESVKKAQDGVLELLLVNHPLDCPVCDKGGECPLQDQTLAFGPGETRFVEEKRHWEKPIPLSSLVHLDRERCIQCDRCTRFADEVAGDPLIEFVGRGSRTEINTFPHLPFSSYFSGNTVQICPVGALTAAPYRFRARPWDLEQVESTCTSCAVGCRVAVQSSNAELTRYLGIDSDPVNQGWLCDKGRFDFEAVNSDERLRAPLVRKGDELVPASWGEALAAAGKGLSEARRVHGSGALGVLGGARLPNEDAYAWAKLAKSVLGTDNVDCQLGDGLPADVVLGLPRATIDDACRARAVVLLAPDLKEELPVLYLRLRAAAVDRGVPLVELTPRRTGLSPYARATVTYVGGHAAGAARRLVDGEVPEVGGLLGEGDVVVVLGRPSLAESGESIAAAAAVLSRLPGVRFLPALRRANVHGALDMGLAPGVLPGRVALDAARQWFSQEWGVIPESTGLDATGMLQAAAGGRLHGLVLLGADPLRDFPDRRLATEALTGAGFVVAVDTFLTESSRRADVVLPAATYAERPGTTTNQEGRVTRLGQKLTAPGVAWPDWMIAIELAARVGGDLGLETLEDLWDEIERLAPSHAGITRAVLNDRHHVDGVVAPLAAAPAVAGPARTGALDVGAGATRPIPAAVDPSATPGIGEVEQHGVPSTAVAAGAAEPEAGGAGEKSEQGPAAPDERGTGEAPLRPAPIAFDADRARDEPPHPDAYALRLVTSRVLYDQGTLVQHSPSLAGLEPAAKAHVNPHDLEMLGVGGGARLRLRTHRTSFVVDTVPDQGVPRGALWMAFNLAGDGPADLVDAGNPVTDVRVETT